MVDETEQARRDAFVVSLLIESALDLHDHDVPDFDDDRYMMEDDDPAADQEFDEMDRVLDEDFAERSPYRGMTREEREAYDRRFIENEEAGTFRLGDILAEAIRKKVEGAKSR